MGDGADFKDWVLALAGNIFIVLFIVRSVGAYAKKEWSELTVNILAGVLIAGFVYFTDGTIDVLKQIWTLITGA
jgi:hypothetical protein